MPSFDVDIDTDDIAGALGDRDAAEVVSLLAGRAAYIAPRMGAYERGIWLAALKTQPQEIRPSGKASEVLGKHWAEIEEMLASGDIGALRRWLRPIVAEMEPNPLRAHAKRASA